LLIFSALVGLIIVLIALGQNNDKNTSNAPRRLGEKTSMQDRRRALSECSFHVRDVLSPRPRPATEAGSTSVKLLSQRIT
jgi:hypothetical protein